MPTRGIAVACAVAGGVAALLTFGGANSATAGDPTAPIASVPTVGQLRLPPTADGVLPPEQPGIEEQIAAIDAHYSLSADESVVAHRILEADRDFSRLLNGAPYTIEHVTAWKGAHDTKAKGAQFNLKFHAPLSRALVSLPSLSKGDGPLMRHLYKATFSGLKEMTVMVRFSDNAVVDVLIDSGNPGAIIFHTLPQIIESED